MDKAYTDLICTFPLFSTLTSEQIEELVKLFTVNYFNIREIIVKEEDSVDSIYFIFKGMAEVRISAQPIAVLGPWESIGLSESGFFSSTGIRTATVTALTPVTVLCLDIQAFDAFLNKYPLVNQSIRENLDVLLRMRFIKKALPFAKLSIEMIRKIAGSITEISVPAGSILFEKGEKGGECYLIQSGRVDISIRDKAGDTKKLASLGTGDLFGEAALLLDTPRNASALITEETKLLVIKKDLLMDVMKKEESTAKAVLLLHQRRARPIKMPNVEVFHHQSSDGEELITLKENETNNYFQLSSHGFFIWQLLDGTRNLKDILREFYREFQILDISLILNFILDLQEAGFVSLAVLKKEIKTDAISPWVRFLLTLRKVMEAKHAFGNVDAWISRTYKNFFWIFYTQLAQYLFVLLSIAGLAAFIFNFNHATLLLNTASFKWTLFFSASYTCVFTFVLHELAHAYTTKAFGKHVSAFGLGWLWLSPIAFCDTSDMWLCADKKSRIAVDLAGVYFNFILGSSAALLSLFIINHSNVIIFLWLFALFNYLTVFANLSPLLELDGYYALMDILNKPNLRESSIILIENITSKNTAPVFTLLKQHPEESIYWGSCLFYIALEALIPYVLTQYVFYSFPWISHPAVGIGLSLMVVVFSGLGIWAELKQKKLLR